MKALSIVGIVALFSGGFWATPTEPTCRKRSTSLRPRRIWNSGKTVET